MLRFRLPPRSMELSSYYDKTHPCVNTTIGCIRNRYDWKGIHENVAEYVSLYHQHLFVLLLFRLDNN